MALWDPEAAGNAAKYLRLDDITLIDIRNAPFEGRTACWIPFAETGYTKGKKTGKEETDEKTKVKKIEVERLVDGKMKMFKEEDVEPQNPPKYELLEDMANMTYLSEASVVHNLKSRYEIFLIYTVSSLDNNKFGHLEKSHFRGLNETLSRKRFYNSSLSLYTS